MWEYATRLKVLDEIVEESRLSEADALEIGERVKKGLARRYAAEKVS
jgi:hypothetical protein